MKTKPLRLLFVIFLFSPQVFATVINSQPNNDLIISDDSKQLATPFLKIKPAPPSLPYYLPMEAQEKSYHVVRDLNKNNFAGEKKIIVDPVKHTWSAYSASGKLLRSGIATAGASFCPDIGRRCKTQSGVFRINSLGSAGCKSKKYPLPYGGAPMPYCMFFNGSQGLHGSYNVVRGNASHGCVRLKVDDARWIRFNFATIGTKVIIKPY